jgi:hypothetical protein
MSKHSVPGWVSNGPVQINVGRDLHIHGCGGRAELPDDIAPPSGRSGWSLAKIIGVVIAVAVCVPIALAGAALAATVIAAICTTALGAVIVLWIVGRSAELLLLLEDALGGGRWRLAIVSSLMGQSQVEVVEQPPQPRTPTAKQLGPGNPRELVQLNQREAQYVDSN